MTEETSPAQALGLELEDIQGTVLRQRPSPQQVNDFTNHQQDPRGLRCLLGAHIRRMNPRDSLADEAGSLEGGLTWGRQLVIF